jgi:penicillin-binding protein 2
MLRDFRKNKVFSRRAAIVGGAQVGLFSVLVARLGYLQIFKYDEYSTKSDSNRIRPLVANASRGLIMDRNGKALTSNRHNYRLLLYTENRPNIQKTVEILTEILALTEEDQAIILSRVKNSRRKSIISLMDNLSWDDVSRVEANYHKLTGVSIEGGISRSYPFPFETAHLVGYVSLPSEKEIAGQEKNLFLHPDFRIGKSGIEKTFDEVLRGKFGVRYVEVNAFGIPIRTLSKKESVEGGKISLTINIDLQKFIYERIKDLVVSVVVMDVKTGEIISMVSNPSFDPDKFVEGVSRNYWQELTQDQRKPMNNKPISATYPPGSTFKLMVAIAALETGINPLKKVFCNGSFQLGKRKAHCWKKEGHGNVDMSDAIKHSCNTYFFDVSNQIGIAKIAEVAKRFGYGEYFDVSLLGVKSGNVPSDEWKQKVFKQPWVGGDTLNTAIGQGFVLATALQMAVVTARLANGGVPIKPYLVKNKNVYSQYQELQDQPLTSKKNIDLVLNGMKRVVNEAGGTAYGKKIDIKGFEMIGKTGTSQVISKREDEMSQEEIDSHQNHAIFVGAAPAHNPKYSISVIVEHGGAGSATAAPIGRDILLELQQMIAQKRF